MDEWVNEWMEGWMDGLMVVYRNGWMDWLAGCILECIGIDRSV